MKKMIVQECMRWWFKSVYVFIVCEQRLARAGGYLNDFWLILTCLGAPFSRRVGLCY